MSQRLSLVVLAGDGIGPEVIEQALRVLDRAARLGGITLELSRAPFGGASIDELGVPASPEVLAEARRCDAVLLGAVGGPAWDDQPPDRRPERGLLDLRQALGAYANLRPARCFPDLVENSPLRPERVGGADFVVVRELIGGIYFGTPRGLMLSGTGRRATNTMSYDEHEIARVGRLAFDLAARRSGRLTSVDKANVLEVSGLWRQVMNELAAQRSEVRLDHLYVDNAAMQLVNDPRRFDVIVTGNLFGDILSDIAGALTGTLGMLPSASIGDGVALYEPVHGSAPDIAGSDRANPLGAILSVAMCLEHTARRPDLAAAVEGAVAVVLARGLRTADLMPATAGRTPADEDSRLHRVGCDDMGSAVVAELDARLGQTAHRGITT